MKCSAVSLHVDGLSNGDADFPRVSSKEKQTLRPGGEAEQGQAAKTILVVTETRSFRTQPFVFPDETNRVGKGWEGWLEGIERELRYFRITETRKTPQLFYGGKEIARPGKSQVKAYQTQKWQTNTFTPKKNNHHARYLGLKMRPHVGETTSA